jgi:Endonuclease IV
MKLRRRTLYFILKLVSLDAMELTFTRFVNVTENNKDKILKSKHENSIYLSAHSSYYINLNAEELGKQAASIDCEIY